MPNPRQKGWAKNKKRSGGSDRPNKKVNRTSKIKSQKFSLSSYLFALTFLFLLLISLFDISKGSDFNNSRVQDIGWLIPLHYTIYVLVGICFLYYAVKVVESRFQITSIDRIVLLAAFICSTLLYVTSFKKEISPNGDNAEYLIVAKSLVEKGAAYRLDVPGEPPNTLASLGLPLMLSPLYAIWGYDFIKLKLFIVLLSVLLFPILFFLFRSFLQFPEAALLTILGYTSPYLIGTSSLLMTEAPYLFWSMLGLAFALRYILNSGFSWKLYLAVLFAFAMTYLTRAVGLGLFAAVILTLFLRISDRKQLQNGFLALRDSPYLKKFVYMLLPPLLLLTLFQIYQGAKGVSQFTVFLRLDNSEVLTSLDSAYRVISQMIFSATTFRWSNFSALDVLPPMNILWQVLFIVLLIAILASFWRKNLLGIYVLITALLICLGSGTPAEMVILRYLSVLCPVIIYLYYSGFKEITKFIAARINRPQARKLPVMIVMLLMSQILFTNFKGAPTNVALAVIGNGPNYADYYDVAKWCSKNLPEDSYIFSTKPRLFYLYSGKKGARITGSYEEYDKEFERKKLQQLRNAGATHIVIDHISAYTRLNIFPIVENHPQLFTPLYVAGISGTSSVLKIENLDDYLSN